MDKDLIEGNKDWGPETEPLKEKPKPQYPPVTDAASKRIIDRVLRKRARIA